MGDRASHILWAGKAEKGRLPFLRITSYRGELRSARSELSFSQRQRKIAKARFTPIEIYSHWGTIYRLGELILMLKNLRK